MNAAAAAALAAIEEQVDLMDDISDTPALSKKELKKAMSMKQKGSDTSDSATGTNAVVEVEEQVTSNKKSKNDFLADALLNEASLSREDHGVASNGMDDSSVANSGSNNNNNNKSGMSKKDLMLQKALELEQADEARSSLSESTDESETKLTAKELKALKKKEEKMAAKLEKKVAKKSEKSEKEDSDDEEEDLANENNINGSAGDEMHDGDGTLTSDNISPGDEQEEEITLEDKIRKERPPPRIRVMESVQAGYVSIRMENVGITFRNQEVLKDVTWGVQNGDRIGLVGANGAGSSKLQIPVVPV